MWNRTGQSQDIEDGARESEMGSLNDLSSPELENWVNGEDDLKKTSAGG